MFPFCVCAGIFESATVSSAHLISAKTLQFEEFSWNPGFQVVNDAGRVNDEGFLICHTYQHKKKTHTHACMHAHTCMHTCMHTHKPYNINYCFSSRVGGCGGGGGGVADLSFLSP